MKSGIKDKNGKMVKVGDVLVFPYIDPGGTLHENEKNFAAVVQFKHGCFGYENQTNFVPLMEWSKKKQGDYVPNCGNKTIILDEYSFWIEE